MEPELLADYACETGENPLWHPTEARVYWLDIPRGRMFSLDWATGEHRQVLEEDLAIGGAVLHEGGGLLLFMEHGRVVRWQGGEIVDLTPRIEEIGDTRFNDAVADPSGRVFSGTMPNGESLLFRFDLDGSHQVVQRGLKLSNGMDFSPDRKILYHTDSEDHTIWAYDYDEETGALSGRREFARVNEGEDVVPDGLTVDAEGYVWSARWNGSALVRHRPDGSEDMWVPFPTKKVSSVIFGGRDLDELYVTTAGGDDKEENGEHAGALFRVRPKVRGLAPFVARVTVSER
jgi:D-xylono/L-arabinono-1,4-lactonase